MRSRIDKGNAMTAYQDNRTGRWRYRVWCTLPNGTRERITGTPATDTKKAAEHAERLHVFRVMNPGLVPEPTNSTATERRKEMPTFREYVAIFLKLYKPTQKPSARASTEQILNGHLLPFFGGMFLDEILQAHVDAFTNTQKVGPKTLNNGCGSSPAAQT